MKLKLSIIIVNYYSEELILECLNSIKQSNLSKEFIEVIIIDNGSNTTLLSEIYEPQVYLIKNNTNKGFGAACNIGASHAKSKNLIFLNPDTKVFKKTLNDALIFFENNPDITVLGCQQVDENNNILRTCTLFITPYRYIIKTFNLDKLFPAIFKSYLLRQWNHKDSRYVSHVMGSFYMIRKEFFVKLNGFDESFFMYYEDADLSKRILNTGGRIYFNTNFKIYHEGGGASKSVKAQRLFYSLDAILIFSKKHNSHLDYLFLSIFICFFEFFLRLTVSVLKLNFTEFKQTTKAYKLLWRKRIFNVRRNINNF